MKNRDKLVQEVMHSAGRLSSHRSGAFPITRGKYPARWSSLPPEARAVMLYILIPNVAYWLVAGTLSDVAHRLSCTRGSCICFLLAKCSSGALAFSRSM
jgi:hypothetical protein